VTLVLASASASRRKMLEAAGVTFQVCAADINEDALTADLRAKGADAVAIALALAEQKALAISCRMPGDVVLGADSVLALGTELIGKCHDMGELKSFLGRMAGKSHELISAAALARNGAVFWRHSDAAHLTMRRFTDNFLDAYLAAEGQAVLSSVGGYHYEGRGAQLFERVMGDNFTIRGLPLLPLLAELRAEGLLQA
jgi:septum formation protein